MKNEQEASTGVLIEIQRFCLHDGPGIRTTVFFKGCPLRCRWCANPESQQHVPQIQFISSNCIGCGNCISVCPVQAVKGERGKAVNFCPEKCITCQRCVPECAGRALKVSGKRWSLEELVQEVMKDQVFFREGGGVTFSGGEVLSQAVFAEKLAGALHEKGIHITCETCGFSGHEEFQKLLDWCDLLYLDIKHWEEEKHVEGTGKSRKIILEHLKMAVEAGIPMAVRIPVIPDYNDSDEDGHGFGVMLREYGVRQVHLLPFHQFGAAKYRQLGRAYEYDDYKAVTEEELEPFARVLKSYIPNVRIGG